MKHLYIVTGASRGLGAAMVERLLAPEVTLLGLSRQVDPRLNLTAQAARAELEQWPRDLSDALPVADEVEGWLHAFDANRFDEATLINNAGAITRVGPTDTCLNAEIASALRVGLEAAMLLTASFLRATAGWRAQRKVLNISSGLGRRPMAGCAVYCAAKAGLDHFSRAVALDEAHRGSGVRIVALAPGVIDTDMQATLRAADPDGFPEQAEFASRKLSRPEDAAASVLAYLRRADFGAQPVADVRD